MSDTGATPTPAPDWLWHYLQRVPPEEALLRASEARLIGALALPAPLLDLRDRFGRGRLPSEAERQGAHAAAIVVATGPAPIPDAALLTALWQMLPVDAPLLLCLPRASDHSAATWNGQLNRAGFAVLRWHSYYSAAQQQASAALRSPWPQLSYDLTGHYVFTPWHSVLDPLDAQLRPLDALHAPTDSDGCLFFVAQRAPQPVDRPLPPPATDWQSAAPPRAADARAATLDGLSSRPTTLPAVAAAARPAWQLRGPLPTLVLAALSLLTALLALLAMRGQPTAVGGGLFWWLLALAALLATSRAAQAPTPSTAAPARAPTRRIWLLPAGVLSVLLAARTDGAVLIALPLWLLGVLLVFGTLVDMPTLAQRWAQARAWRPPRTPLALALAGTLLLALAVRLFDLGGQPFIVNGIETQLGLEALRVRELFGSGWLTNPLLPLWPTRLSVALFGQTPFALRIWSPFVGTATVLVVFWAGRALWGSRVGLLAALFVAFSHTHIHYSRLGMSNIGDALLVTLALAAIAAGWHSGRRAHWLLAGSAIGAGAYFYTAAHLLPLMLLGLLLPALLDRPTLRRQLPAIGRAALLALAIALPQLLVYAANPAVFMERANLLGIARNGWLVDVAAQNGSNPLTLFGSRLWEAALGFHATLDRDSVYNPQIPLLNVLVGALLLLGLGMALAHLRQMRYAVWLSAFLVTITFGGALLLDLPSSRRYIVALPAVCLLAARAAGWLLDKLTIAWARRSDGGTARATLGIILAIGLLAGALDVSFYFVNYRRGGLFADRNTEIAATVGRYLATLDAPTTVYFHGMPTMYAGDPTIAFLAPTFEIGVNLYDVAPVADWPAATTPAVVHLFVPERSAELATVTAARPGGTLLSVTGRYADPLYLAYVVEP